MLKKSSKKVKNYKKKKNFFFHIFDQKSFLNCWVILFKISGKNKLLVSNFNRILFVLSYVCP